MSRRIEVYAGTAGHSAWFSEDRGETWLHPNSHSGMYLEARVWTFSSHPARPGVLHAGTDMGIHRWDESTTRWTPVPSPLADVWALAQSPVDPDVLYAGGRPAAVYCSEDGGASWRPFDLPGAAAFSPINQGPTRVTQILVDPVDPDVLWATIEIGGIYRSGDRGRTWEPRNEGLVSLDVHGIAVLRKPGGVRTILATTNRGLHRSDDDGGHWTFQQLDSPWQYTRAVVPRADTDRIVFLTNGNGPRAAMPACCEARTMAIPGNPSRFQAGSTARCGASRRIRPIPCCCSPAPTWASCSAASMAATNGNACPTNSAKCAPCTGAWPTFPGPPASLHYRQELGSCKNRAFPAFPRTDGPAPAGGGGQHRRRATRRGQGPFLALLHHPDLADRLQQLGEHLRFGTGLPPELVELAVLVTARHWDCQYEWFAHRRIALNTTSLDAAVIDAIAHGQPLPAMPDEQRDACDFCGELLRDGEPGERAYDAILQRYGRRGVLDLLALCGYYGLLAMVLNTARIPLPDGTPAPLPPKHRS